MATLDVALFILSAGIGLIFAVHGAQKLFGSWAGPGLAGWTGAMSHMGFRPARLFATVSAAVEFVGGILLIVGLLTPLAAAALVAQSIVIIGIAHWRKGFFNKDGGYEFPLALATGVTTVLFAGPGAYSLDAVIGFALEPVAIVVLFVIAVAGGLAMLGVPALTTARAQTSSEASQAR